MLESCVSSPRKNVRPVKMTLAIFLRSYYCQILVLGATKSFEVVKRLDLNYL